MYQSIAWVADKFKSCVINCYALLENKLKKSVKQTAYAVELHKTEYIKILIY